MTTLEIRLAQRLRPPGRPRMYHSWRHLSFLHWAVPAEDLQKLLPFGLRVDTHEGKAYVGLVPFTMHGIRLSWLTDVHGASASYETNVRTYVVDKNGVPGVWFFSLDASNALLARIARRWYRLPYNVARMYVGVGKGHYKYVSERTWPSFEHAKGHVEVTTSGAVFQARPGSLEFFLVERYVLFAFWRGRLYSGRVFHEPYPLLAAECSYVKESMLKAVQIVRPDNEPLVLFSPGVDVEVFGLRRV
ncbi:MAG: DUF2071 domain-containing protein [Fimbriimonadaceae bacterium]